MFLSEIKKHLKRKGVCYPLEATAVGGQGREGEPRWARVKAKGKKGGGEKKGEKRKVYMLEGDSHRQRGSPLRNFTPVEEKGKGLMTRPRHDGKGERKKGEKNLNL